MKKMLLRIIMIFAVAVSTTATKFYHKELHYPLRWLLHYLVGSGRDMEVPSKIMAEVKDTIKEGILRNNFAHEIGGLYSVHHSTLYEGSGFSNRPTLFYLVGCFNFNWDCRTGIVKGTDYYDWHSCTNGEGDYFTSPIGNSKIVTVLATIAGKLFGYDLFLVPRISDYSKVICTDTDQVCISNKLWEVLGEAGAKGFTTTFSHKYNFDKKFLKRVVRETNSENLEEKKLGYISGVMNHSTLRKYNKKEWFYAEDTPIDGVYYADCGNNKFNRFCYVDNNHVVHIVKGEELALLKAKIHQIEYRPRRLRRTTRPTRPVRPRR